MELQVGLDAVLQVGRRAVLEIGRRPTRHHFGHCLAQLGDGVGPIAPGRQFARGQRFQRRADVEDVLDLLGVEVTDRDQVRMKVNDLLATGASYAMVLRALGDDNARSNSVIG